MRRMTYGTFLTLCLLNMATSYGAGRPEGAGRPGFADRPGFAGRPETPGPKTPFAGPQAGTGRLGRETLVGRGVDGRSLGDRLMGHRRNDRPVSERPDLKRTADASADDTIQTTNVTNENSAEQASEATGSDHRRGSRGPHDRTNQAERLLAQRLASIDHLRDIALENGNTRLLERADQLEELARRQFLMRTEGQKLDWGSYQKSRREGAGDATPDETAPTSPGESIAPGADSTPPSDVSTEPGDG